MPLPRSQPMTDIKAERFVLSSILRDNRCLEDVLGLTPDTPKLSPDDFSNPLHQDCFSAVLSLSAANAPIDAATVSDSLRTVGKLQGDEDEDFIAELFQDEYSTVKIARHAWIVKRCSIRRKLKQVSIDIQREVECPSDPENLLDMIEQMVLGVRERGTSSETKPLQHYLQQTLSEISAVENGSIPGLSTGIAGLDKYISLRPGQLTLIGARPGVGKSISGLQFGLYAADNGNAVAIYSLEMSGEELAARAISAYAGIDADYVTRKRPELNDAGEAAATVDAVSRMYRLPVYINERPWNTIQGIVADARRLKRKHDIKLVVVDYLQLVQHIRPKGQLRYEQLGEITQSLKQLAKELKIPVILLAQLNRESEKNGPDKEPQLHHFKEGGSGEQDADIALLMWPKPDEFGLTDRVNIKVAKNRHGRSGVTIQVRHAKQFMRFVNDGVY